MERRILIIDDHDDLASAMRSKFVDQGHKVAIVEDRDSAMQVERLESFDVVLTDLDVPSDVSADEAEGRACIPSFPVTNADEHLKVFKFCASNFRRDDFDESELTNILETILRYKLRFVDTVEVVADMRERIEFELPSAISPMHSILDYLLRRVKKLGGPDPDKSNLFVALDEAFVNAVKHGNKYNSQKLVRITAEISRQEASFTVEDEGEGFDVNSIPDPRDPSNLFKPSGRGVLFIYNIMDEVKYNDRGNRLTMVKKSPVGSGSNS